MSPPHPVRFHLASFLLGGLIVGLAAGLFLLLARAPQPQPVVLHPPPTPAPTSTALPTATPAPAVVYVSGAVVRPGLYSVPGEARVGDALEMAGGFREDAAEDALNLAERLWDGARVHVGSRTEAAESPPGGDSGGDSHAPETGVSGLQPTTTTPGAESSGNTGTAPAGMPINLNTASQSELETLPGIGPARAAAIIEERPYSRVDEITRVSGIGDAILAQLRELVTVE